MTTADSDNLDRVLSHRLRAVGETERLELARETLQRLGGRFDSTLCRLLLEECEKISAPLLNRWLDSLPDSANSAWLQAQLLPQGSELTRAWERFFSYRAPLDPLDLLASARALA